MGISTLKKITWYYYAAAFFILATSFFWKTLNPIKPLSFIVDFVVLSLVPYFIIVLSMGKVRSTIPLIALLFTAVLVFLSYTNDSAHVKDVVHLKTFVSISSAFVLGYFLYIENTHHESFYTFFCSLLIKFSVVLNLLIIVLLYNSGWDFTSSLLAIEGVREHYQGLGRLLGLLSLFYVVAGTKNGLNCAPLIILNTLISVSLGGVGALLVYPLIAFFIARQTKYFGPILLFFFVCSIALLFNQVDNLALSAERLIWRIQGKMEFDGPASDSRLGLMILALELWLKNLTSFIFGVGIWNYSCEVYACDYRHAHNIFMNFIVFFGLLGLLLSILVLVITNHVMVTKRFSNKLFKYTYFYWFGLALVGGDLDQNRNFFIVTFYFLLTLIYQRRNT